MPNFSGPLRASPESLTITRRYLELAIVTFRPSPPLSVGRQYGYRIRTRNNRARRAL
jgi:hypothetical protein